MRYEPDLEALRVLALVAKESSMSAASAQLGVSQQAISLRIRNLEKDLRMRLLVRSARGSQLTPAGELVVGWGTTLLTAADEFSDAVNSLRTDRGKMMRIAASLTIAEHLLPDWIARWRISHGNDGPAVQLTAANSSTVVEAIREGTADLGLVETPVVPADLRSVTVAYDTIEVVVQHGHRWAKTRRVSVRELAGTGLVLRETGSGTRRALENALAVSEDARAGRLVRVRINNLQITRPLTAIWAGTAPPPHVRDFLDVIARTDR